VLGEELHKARLATALTQEELAEKNGLTREYISQIERGQRIPTLPVFVRLCKTLGISTEKLVNIINTANWPKPANAGKFVQPRPQKKYSSKAKRPPSQ
jgi:transcriptional regulator with XRE-family HTH domain